MAVALVLGLARKYLRPPTSSKPKITEADRAEFRKINWVVNFVMLSVMVLFAFTTYKLLLGINRYFANAEGPARFQLLPTKVIWMFFPGLGGLWLSWEITMRLWSLFAGRERVAEYGSWSDERAGFGATTMLRWLALLIALPVGIATILALPMHSTLQDSEISIRTYASATPLRLRYSDARRLTVVQGFRDRSGKFTARAEVLIDFANGYRWHSESNRDFRPEVDVDFLTFLEEKTGLQARRIESEQDLPAMRP